MADYLADPASVLDYVVDWTSWLAAGETLTASSWTVGTGITQTTPSPSFTTVKATIWLTGGTADSTYRITNHITTSAGRQDERSFTVRVLDR